MKKIILIFFYFLFKNQQKELSDRRAKKIIEPPEVKRERLLNWWQVQYDKIEAHRNRRKLYKLRASRCMKEVDVDLHIASDNRDYIADNIAEKVRADKKKLMSSTRRRK